MKKNINPLILSQSAAVAVFLATVLSSSAQTTTIYSDSFSGSGNQLNGTPVEVGGQTWSANLGWQDNGIATGGYNGSAVLPFTPVANMVYTLSADLKNWPGAVSPYWIGLGFADHTIQGPGQSVGDDRFTTDNTGTGLYPQGIAWGYIRADYVSGSYHPVETFGGPGTSDPLFSVDPAGADYTQFNNFKIVLSTLGGSLTLVDMQFNGTSLLGAPQSLSSAMSDIKVVGMTWASSASDPTMYYNNFLLTEQPVPEPATGALVLLGLGAVMAMRRVRR